MGTKAGLEDPRALDASASRGIAYQQSRGSFAACGEMGYCVHTEYSTTLANPF